MELRASSKASFSWLMKIALLLALSLCETVNADEGNDKEVCSYGDDNFFINTLWDVTTFCVEPGHFFSLEIVRNASDVLLNCMCGIEPCGWLCSTSTNPMKVLIGSKYQARFPFVYETNLAIEGGGDSTLTQAEQFHFFVWSPCDVDFLFIVNSRWFIRLPSGSFVIKWQQHCLYDIFYGTIHGLQKYTLKYNFRHVNYGGIISIPFLTATIIVYSILPKLGNIHGKIIRCYLSSNVLSNTIFVAMWRSHLGNNYPTLCKILGFGMYFADVTSFLWLNVVCFNMWRKFRSCVTSQSNGRLHDRKKLIGYSIYAWGIGSVLTGVCIGMELSPNLPKWVIRPRFEGACWFVSQGGASLYYRGPIGVSLFGSFCLFILTLMGIIKHKIETHRHLNREDSQRHHNDNFSYTLYLKLFIIMGAGYSFEVLPRLWPNSALIWYLNETVIGLQSVLIFVIFVCKKKIWQMLKKRFNCYSRSNHQENDSTLRTTNSVTITRW